MYQRFAPTSWPRGLRRPPEFGRRAAGIAAALLIEAMLAVALLGLAPTVVRQKEKAITVVNLSAQTEPEQRPAPPDSPAPVAQRTQSSIPVTRRTPPPTEAEPTMTRSVSSFVELSREEMAAADIAAMRAGPAPAAAPSNYGPAYVAARGDTPRVEGAGPNGEPLYAASWYREPYDNELRGYLSTARGPGWGIIACRTAPDFRVEDCVAAGESPEGSDIARAVLAAAWQFRVRPPQIGGQPKIGEWVRIRIDYERRQS